jgi:SAM-dependent methyltransferase
VRGDAAALPFPDRSFDVVWSRFAFHHMPGVEAPLAEMRRVCRPSGRLALLDVVALDDDVAEEHNRLERLRDPSHSTHFTEEGLTAFFTGAGIEPTSAETLDYRMDTEPWLDQALPGEGERDEILRALDAEEEGGSATGLRPGRHEGRRVIRQTWLMLVGRP